MAEILAERLDLLRRPASSISVFDDAASDSVRAEIRQPGLLERAPEDGPNWRGTRPAEALQSIGYGPSRWIDPRRRLREDRIVWPVEEIGAEIDDPIGERPLHLIAEGQEDGFDQLAVLRPHARRVLHDQRAVEFDMAEAQRSGGAVSRARHHDEGEKRPVSPLDLCPGGHLGPRV